MRVGPLCLLLLLGCHREPPPPSADPAPSATHQYPPVDPRLEPDEPHPSAETATLVSASNTIAVLPTAADVDRMLTITRDAKARDAGFEAIGDFALAAHAAPVAAGTDVKIVAAGPEWYQISVQIGDRLSKGFVPRFMVKRAPYEAPLSVDIKELLAEYKANELRADGRWKGKIIQTFGTVIQVGKGFHGEPFVTLGTGARLEIPAAQCFLSDPADVEAVGLSAGGVATIRGRVDHLLGHVMIKDCVVNPMAHLCEHLKAATGGVGASCSRYAAREQTGDVTTISFEDNEKHDDGLIGVLFCELDQQGGKYPSASARYPEMMTLVTQKPGAEAVGSARVYCYAQFAVVGKKRAPTFPEPLRAKVQAFFEAL
jgi:hypothetical protein